MFLFIFYTASFSQSAGGKFEIAGTLTGYADSTKINLFDFTTPAPVLMDSTFIVGNHFVFTGSLQQPVQRVLIRMADFSEYKYFWLENTNITFSGEKGKMREAAITGSKTQDEEKQLTADIDASGNEKQSTIAFIKSHPTSIVSAEMLSRYASTWGKDTVAMLYNHLSQAMKDSKDGKNIAEYIKLNKNIKVGDQYADFTEPNTEGKNVSLSDYRGKLVLLEFWGSWCEPCRKGNPELIKIYNDYKEKGFDVLGVAADADKKQWLDAVKEDALPWQNVTDLKGDKNKAALMYGIDRYPYNYLIDKNGTIIAKDLRGDALRDKLKEVLK